MLAIFSLKQRFLPVTFPSLQGYIDVDRGFLSQIFCRKMANCLSVALSEPTLFNSRISAVRIKEELARIVVGEMVLSLHICFYVSNLCFLPYLLWQSETPERQKAKQLKKALGWLLLSCLLQVFKFIFMFIRIHWISGNDMQCQKIQIFTINIQIYSPIASFHIFFLWHPHFTALTLSQSCWGGSVQEGIMLPVAGSSMWCGPKHCVSLRGASPCRIPLQARNLMGCKVQLCLIFASTCDAFCHSFNFWKLWKKYFLPQSAPVHQLKGCHAMGLVQGHPRLWLGHAAATPSTLRSPSTSVTTAEEFSSGSKASSQIQSLVLASLHLRVILYFPHSWSERQKLAELLCSSQYFPCMWAAFPAARPSGIYRHFWT